MRPKLCFLLPEYDINTDSHYTYIYTLLEHLGESVDIFLIIEKTNGAPTIKNQKHIYTQKWTTPPFSFLERAAILIWVRSLGINQIYVYYDFWAAIIASLISHVLPSRVFIWHCEVYEKFFSQLKWNTLRKKLLDEYPTALAFKWADHLVTGTKSCADFYTKTFALEKSSVKVVPNFILPEKFQHSESRIDARKHLNLDRDKKIVLWLHTLSPRKGVRFMPEIIARVSVKIPDVQFIIAGGGPEKIWLTDQLTKANLLKFARLEGGVPNREVNTYFQSSDLFLMPSRQEGFPRVLLEAMSAGVPFVATSAGGTTDIISPLQAKHIARIGDTHKLSNEIVSLLTSKSKRDKLISEGKVQVQKFTLPKVLPKYLRLLRV